MAKQSTAAEASVGIFWVEDKTIHAHAVLLSAGLDDGNCVNGPLDHVDYWPELERQHPRQRGREYSELPRGRVVYRRGVPHGCHAAPSATEVRVEVPLSVTGQGMPV